jgi:hypothetical protein
MNIDQSLVDLAIVRTEPRYGVPEIGTVELCLSVDLARQETLTSGPPRKWLNSAGMAEMSHCFTSNFSPGSAFK